MSEITLKAARVNKGLTQDDACKILNVSKKTLGSWESGKTFPKQPAIEKMCELYGVKFDQIRFEV